MFNKEVKLEDLQKNPDVFIVEKQIGKNYFFHLIIFKKKPKYDNCWLRVSIMRKNPEGQIVYTYIPPMLTNRTTLHLCDALRMYLRDYMLWGSKMDSCVVDGIRVLKIEGGDFTNILDKKDKYTEYFQINPFLWKKSGKGGGRLFNMYFSLRTEKELLELYEFLKKGLIGELTPTT